jgi:hypothetical protein
MDTTIAWMIGRPSGSEVPTERRLSHLRALRGNAAPRPTLTARVVAAARGYRSSIATASGPSLDAACCPA